MPNDSASSEDAFTEKVPTGQGTVDEALHVTEMNSSAAVSSTTEG